MIEDVDETLRRLLMRDLPVKNGEIDIVFDQPKREWSARVNRPTLNLFMHDLHENVKLRNQPGWTTTRTNGKAIRKRNAMRIDLHYMITAWATEAEDEHRLLARTMLALTKYPTLPEDLLPTSLQDQPVPIPIEVAQPNAIQNPADIWSVLDNEMRPAIPCIVTISLDPYEPVTGPLVRTRELRFGSFADLPTNGTIKPENAGGHYWTIGGTLHSDKSLADVSLKLVERGLEIPLLDEGRFVITKLQAGDYTLEVSVKGRKPRRHKLSVPAPDYDIEV